MGSEIMIGCLWMDERMIGVHIIGKQFRGMGMRKGEWNRRPGMMLLEHLVRCVKCG